MSARPLIYGLIRSPQPGVEMIYDETASLAERLRRGELEAALIPSIEFLRGAGQTLVEGPALVARPGGRATLLITQRPIETAERIAVNEFCRSPIVAVRVVLDRLWGVRPDLLVEKNLNDDWRERYDAVLLNGDAALDFVNRGTPPDLEAFSVGQMWLRVTGHPLVQGVWVYSEPELETRLSSWLITSRNLGLQNLSRLADGIAATSHYGSEVLYDYFANSWSYNLGPDEMEGLRALEELALEYDLIRQSRLAPVYID